MNFNNNNNSTTTPLGSSLLHVASTSLFHPSSSNKNNTISTNQIVNQNSNVYHSTMNPSLFSSSPSHAPPPPHHHHIISNTHGGMMNNTSTNSHHHHHHSINTSSNNNNNNNLATSTPNPTTPYGSQVGQSGFNFQSQTTSPFLHASSSTPIPTGPNNLFQFSSGSHALRSQPSNTMSFQTHSNHPTTTSRLLQESSSSQDDLFSVDKFFRHSTVDRTTTPIPTFQQQQISTNSAASRPTTMASSGGPPMNPSNHNNNFSPPLSSQWSHNYVASSTTSPRQPTNQTSDMMNHHGMIMDHQRRTMTSNSQLVNNSLLLPSQPHASQPSQQLSSHNLSVVNEEKSQIGANKKSKKKNNQTSSNLEIGQQPSQEIHEPTSTTMPNPSAKPKKQVAKESSTTSKTVSSVNNQGSIKVTRNISAERVENPTEPVEFPIDGVLYAYNVADWTDKNSFYDKIAYSFGTPSTQKKVHCAYLNCKVMHYERTCQGVYYCPHTDGDDSDHCIVRPCRLRFHTCQKHNNTTLTKSGKCPFKLHFYVPLEKDDNRRLLLCIGTHNHPLLCESDAAAMNSGITMGEKKSKINNVASSGSSTVMMPSTQDGSSTSQRKVAPKRTRKEKQPQTNSSNTAHASTTHQNYPQPTQNTPTQGMTMSQPSGYSSVSGNTSGQQPYYSSSTANLMEEQTSLNGSNTPTTNHASHHHPLNSSTNSNVAAMSPPPSVKTLTRSTPPNMLSGSGGHHQGHHGSSNTYSGSSKIMSSSTPPLHDHTQQYNTSPTNPSSQLLGTCQKSTMNSFGGSGAMGGSASKIPPAASLTTTTTTLLQPSDYLQHVAKPPSYSLNNYNKDVDITRNPHNSVQSSPTSFMSASSPSLYRFSPNYPLPSSSTSSPHHHYSPHPPRINSSPLSLTSPSPLSGLYHPSPTSQFPPLPTQSSPSLFYEQNNAYGGVRNPSPHAIVYRGGNEDMDGVNARKRERLDGSFDAQKKVKTDFIDEPTPNINLPPIMYPSSDF
ncbi:hypothetical protein C9374_010131 [Naegleria lovaniensis]|uniref:Uncharacterized protein n=1 Tax=Naegleria lovaniensis TaxID=51637 RepID=A0AA88KJQ6_NAELO|nr:uncharacterized protein C9374_010131 [Naegleria lovaniensis]KAG2375127.1 hypothetical protein C9374_010131 [Naegleria lovaniensis]